MTLVPIMNETDGPDQKGSTNWYHPIKFTVCWQQFCLICFFKKGVATCWDLIGENQLSFVVSTPLDKVPTLPTRHREGLVRARNVVQNTDMNVMGL